MSFVKTTDGTDIFFCNVIRTTFDRIKPGFIRQALQLCPSIATSKFCKPAKVQLFVDLKMTEVHLKYLLSGWLIRHCHCNQPVETTGPHQCISQALRIVTCRNDQYVLCIA